MCTAFDEDSFVGDDDSRFFRKLHGRTRSILNHRYILPADEDEVKRFEFHHRIMQFVFEGQNYIGPVRDILTYPGVMHRRRVLDIGTGAGQWAIEMADEFPRTEVVGVDLSPIQPREVPPNCCFELCDLDYPALPYVSNYYDVIHARSMHTGIGNYPRFIHELSRMLRPGGMLLLVEPDSQPVVDGQRLALPVQIPSGSVRPAASYASGAPGWCALWEAYRTCMTARGVDVNVPPRLGSILARTQLFEKIVVKEAQLPVGFWPKDPTLLTIGQLSWLEYDHMLPALRSLLLEGGFPEWKVKVLIEDAQRDMYEPVMPPSVRLHVVYGIKRS